jgi:hypothetical protein
MLSPSQALETLRNSSEAVSGSPVSPSKQRPSSRSRGGLWESLWQLDISLESGKKK